MSSLALAQQAVDLLKAVGYADAVAEGRQIGAELVGIVTVSANDSLGVFPPDRLILAVDPDARLVT